MLPSAVTSTSSIIIRITTIHPFATSWPSSPKGDARTLRDWLSVSYDMKTILLTGSLRSPPPIRAAPDFSTGKVVAPATKGEMHLLERSEVGLFSDARQGGIKNGAEGAVPPQWNGTSYLPRAEPSTRPGGVSRSRTEPLAPRAKGPAAPSTLAAKPRQPSGILESTAQVPVPVPVPIPTAPQAPHHHPLNPLAKRPFPFFSSMI